MVIGGTWRPIPESTPLRNSLGLRVDRVLGQNDILIGIAAPHGKEAADENDEHHLFVLNLMIIRGGNMHVSRNPDTVPPLWSRQGARKQTNGQIHGDI